MTSCLIQCALNTGKYVFEFNFTTVGKLFTLNVIQKCQYFQLCVLRKKLENTRAMDKFF